MGVVISPIHPQYFGSALGVPEPSFYTGMFNKVDPYANLGSYSVLVTVPLREVTDILISWSKVLLLPFQFRQQETNLLLLLQKGVWKTVRNVTAKD